MAAADYRLMTEATGQRIAFALEHVSAMVGPKGDPGEVSEAELTAKLADKADVIIDTASGAIASFPDGMAVPAKDVTIGIEPVQDLHGYDHPWPAGGSKNLFNPQYFLDAGLVLENGYYKGTQSQIRMAVTAFNADFTFEEDTRYALSYTVKSDADVYFRLLFKYSDDTSSQAYPNSDTTERRASAVSTANKNVVSLERDFSNTGTVWIKDVQLEKSATVTDYVPYSNICPISGWTGANMVVSPTTDAQDGTTYPVSWETEAGTVYDGTLDVTTGRLTVTHGNIASYAGETLPGAWISSMDVYTAGGTPTTGAQVVYELATPQTYQLTPTTQIALLEGVNNVWADCGGISVTYRADTKLYIQKINTPTDDDMIANAQIASGKYFIIGGNLYKSTTTIPAGDTITPGTNCILTNLADALNALNT